MRVTRSISPLPLRQVPLTLAPKVESERKRKRKKIKTKENQMREVCGSHQGTPLFLSGGGGGAGVDRGWTGEQGEGPGVGGGKTIRGEVASLRKDFSCGKFSEPPR
ncbi:hypothetical protein E2C01_068658 [Portunus trituberculatus]|uniref:Uncharacterized protein n=1 Tax=Portunus trituberculatus TaxID=210409 RepID=A0A5B7HMY4_PORTR|nr:hypothetical protein [Portunus trituberculatus]